MSDESKDKAERLGGLLTHPGWQLFVDHVAALWGPKAYAQRIKSAVKEARERKEDTGFAIDVVDRSNDEVAAIMRWPAEEKARCERANEGSGKTMSRRGATL